MYRSFDPHQELSAFIECYWSWRVDPDVDALDDILPDAAPEFIVHMGSIPFILNASGEWRRQHRAFLYCAAHKALRLSVREPLMLFAIRFRPWGVGRFSNASMANMLDRPVPPFESLNKLGDELEKELRLAESDISRVKVADRLLLDGLKSSSAIAPRLKLLLNAANGGRCSSAEMAQKLSVSDRTFSRLWNDVVGIQPRKFVQLMRFHNALEMIDRGAKLSQVAADCGYSDQAHMARQIKAITGLPPSSLRRRLGNRVYQDLYLSRPGAPWRGSEPA
ncbi:MAG: AraC family transcriptional regulator [Woeseiaceae bacterium]|nr:AraC family transcriptional regulator [Woeseiaceae bacterium]